MRQVNAETLALIKQWEAFVPYAYDDADPSVPKRRIIPGGVRGTLTIGYGHTGPDVKPGMEMSEEAASYCLLRDLASCEQAVEGMVKVDLTDNQFGALVSFAYNAGEGALSGSTLLKRLNAGDYAAVPAEMMRWNKTTIAGQLVVSPGLANRRAAEAGLWARGSHVASSTVEPVAAPQPAGKSNVAAAATAGATSIPTAAVIVDAVSGSTYQISQAQYWLGQHSWLGYLVGGVLLAAVAYMIYSAIKRRA